MTFLYFLGRPGFGASSSIMAMMSSHDQSRSVKPDAIAGATHPRARPLATIATHRPAFSRDT